MKQWALYLLDPSAAQSAMYSTFGESMNTINNGCWFSWGVQNHTSAKLPTTYPLIFLYFNFILTIKVTQNLKWMEFKNCWVCIIHYGGYWKIFWQWFRHEIIFFQPELFFINSMELPSGIILPAKWHHTNLACSGCSTGQSNCYRTIAICLVLLLCLLYSVACIHCKNYLWNETASETASCILVIKTFHF